MCKIEEETVHHLVACNVKMFEDFWKVCRNESCEIELVAVAVKNQLIQEIDFYELVIYVIILDFV